MKKVTLVGLLLFFSVALMAQRIYFIYLQTDDGAPFFLRLNDKIYNSTTSGYLILSRLKDSTYNFKIGFPGKDIDLGFSSTINKKDHGYLIKNFGEKGWGLFDLQTLGVQMSSSNVKTISQINNSPAIQVNAFTELLSKAADDPSLKQNPVFAREEEKKPEEKKTDITQTVVKETRPEIITPPANKPEEKKTDITAANDQKHGQPEKNPVTTKPEEKKTEAVTTNDQKTEQAESTPVTVQKEISYKRSRVTKVAENTLPEGVELVFADEHADGTDTVKIVVPGSKTSVPKEEPGPEVKKEEKKFLDISTDTTKAIKTLPPVAKKEGEKGLWFLKKKKNVEEAKKDCKTVATDGDFIKLRRKMASRTNDDGMINEAEKYFRDKCFTTDQIKNLSSMFLSNAGKYRFFNIAYEHVADKENYSSLQSELNDEYYIKRFKAMLPG